MRLIDTNYSLAGPQERQRASRISRSSLLELADNKWLVGA
ncbi:hypothetical protein QO004_001131 [Rhizobium mesoamericanum]|nr:hypothetical protein [Rhizobium mesoamericanum]